jgi:N-acetylmuramic acid 6-phosphate (MurNAc-6-P) etherase
VTCQKLQDRECILMETAGMERADATALLERAGGYVKTALVMHAASSATRRRLLDEAGAGRARRGRTGRARL